MSDVMALREAAGAMIPTVWPVGAGVPSVHVGEVREARPTLPWVVWSLSTPDGAFAGEDARASAHRLVLSVTVAARSEAEASILLDRVGEAMDGGRLAAPGWVCGVFVPHQPPRSWAESIDLAGASVRAFVAVASWRCVATPLPTS